MVFCSVVKLNRIMEVVGLIGVVFDGMFVIDETDVSVDNVAFGATVVVFSVVVVGFVAFTVKVFVTSKVVFGCVVL